MKTKRSQVQPHKSKSGFICTSVNNGFFLLWHFSPFLPLNIVPTAKWQSADKGQAFIMSLFSIHLGWSAKPPPHPESESMSKEEREKKEWRMGKEKKKKNTTQTLWDVSFVSLSDCSSVGVYVALLSDGDLLTCRDREKRLTARSLCCSVTLNRPWGGARKTTREKERDVGVLCIKVQREKKKKKETEREKKTKSIHPNDQEWMYRSWKCTFSAITPGYHDPSLSNGFPVTNVPSVHHSRAIIMVHYCMCNLGFGIYSFLLFWHTRTCAGSILSM